MTGLRRLSWMLCRPIVRQPPWPLTRGGLCDLRRHVAAIRARAAHLRAHPPASTTRRAVHECDHRTSRYECPDCGDVLPRYTGCTERTCTCGREYTRGRDGRHRWTMIGCRRHVARERARGAWVSLFGGERPQGEGQERRHVDGSGQAAIYRGVFTGPPSVSTQWQRDLPRAARVAYSVFAEEIRLTRFGGAAGRMGGLVVTHPTGEAEQDEHWHLEVWIPAAMIVGPRNDRRWSLHLAGRPLDLERLQLAWRLACEREWGLEPGRPILTPYVQWHEPHRGDDQRAELLHGLRYALRGFPAWQGWTHQVRYQGWAGTACYRMRPPTVIPMDQPTHDECCATCGLLFDLSPSAARPWILIREDGVHVLEHTGPPPDAGPDVVQSQPEVIPWQP